MKYCLIGERLSHSYSSDIHKKRGFDYELIEVPRGKLSDFLREDYDGFNVTIPYKKEIIPYLDGLDESADKIGAVNTVVKKHGKYYGYNTDISGMAYAFSRKGVSLKNKKVLILGSGGTSNTAEALCVKEGASAVKVSRSGKVNYENCYGFKDTEIIINSTPVGMFPNISGVPIDIARFPALSFVFDCVYNPFNTALLQNAAKLGINRSDGLPMLVKQALDAERIWGKDQGEHDAEKIIAELYSQKLNIVLCGMPSSGKTTAGKAVAELLGKKFVDTDAEIYRATGKTPSELITGSGEKVFRDIETEAVKKEALLSGAVIATGGGAVLREENVSALKSNGIIFYIKRDVSLLTSDGRPISQGKGLERLFSERKEFYERAADFSVENNGELKSCAETVARLFSDMKYNPEL